MRDGVSVYGGIDPLYNVDCGTPPITLTGEWEYTDEQIDKYVSDIQNRGEGHIGPNARKVIVSGIKTDQYADYNTARITGTTANSQSFFSLVDGFYATPATMWVMKKSLRK